eukprot:403361073
MGNSVNIQSHKDKTVVIVGGSYAGFTMAEMLWDYFNVIVIDARDHYEHTATNIKCAVDPTWIDKITTPFTKVEQSYGGKFKFVQGYLNQVHKDSIVINKPTNVEEKIRFDYLILATGFQYKQPIKDERSINLNDRKQGLAEYSEKIRNAKSILVAGAGVVGVELLGEIVHAFPDKKLGLCLRGNRLLPALPQKAHNLVDQFFTARKVQIHYNSPYDPNSSQFKNYDVVLQCTGYTFKTDYMKANFSQCIAKSGEIYVNNLMQISAENPTLNPHARGVAQNIYCLGDVAKLHLENAKTIPVLKWIAPYVFKNIMQHASGQQPQFTIPNSLPTLCMVSLGPNWGVLNINGMSTIGDKHGKTKFEITEESMKIMGGDHQLVQKGKKRLNGVKSFLSCITCCCCCCPISNCYTVTERKK